MLVPKWAASGVPVHDVVVDEQARLDELEGRPGPDGRTGDPAPGHLGAERDEAAADYLALPGEFRQAAEDIGSPGLQPGHVFSLGGQEFVQIF